MTTFKAFRRVCNLATALLAVGIGGSAAWAQTGPEALNIISHAVHQRVSVGKAGDITAAFQQQSGTKVNWLTFDIQPLFERLVREAKLSRTTIDVAFVLNSQLTPSLVSLLEPLDAYMAKAPVEAIDDMFKGMVDSAIIDGKLYAIPFRQTPSGLHYNAKYLEERGVKPPRTAEELIEAAKKLTFTRPDGTKVHGLIFTGTSLANIVDLARMYNGDFINSKGELVANKPEMVRTVKLIAELYEAGVLPKNWPQISSDDVDTWMQQGRAAMSIATISKTRNYNNPTNSSFAGQLQVTNLPSSESIVATFPVAPIKFEVWLMAIPRNSANKESAWNLIRAMSSKEAVLTAALNGNGPVRSSTFSEAAYKSQLPWAETEQRALQFSRIPLPAFDNATRAADIFVERVHASALGMSEPQAAMDDVVRRVQPLMSAR